MPIDPSEPLSVSEQATFGAAARRHPITGIPLENGSGALTPKLQAYNLHLPVIGQTEGREAAAAMRLRLDEHYAANTDLLRPTPTPPVEKPTLAMPRLVSIEERRAAAREGR